MSTRTAVYTLVAAALIGVVGTLVTGSEPGFLLGFFVTVGSVVATLGVRRGAVHLFFPLPALVLFITAVLTGAVHDTGLESSTAGFGVGFLQWIADIFYSILVATILVVIVGGLRWLLNRQLVAGQLPMSAGRGPAPRAPRPGPPAPRRAPSDPWGDDGYTSNPRSARPAPPRPAPDPRPARDPWGDPKDPRQAPNGNRPATPKRPVDRPLPPDRDQRDPRGQRPGPRTPRDPWSGR